MASKLFVGVSKKDITPFDGVLPLPFVFGYQMNGVHDPIALRVIEVKNDTNRVIFVSFDLPIIPDPTKTMEIITTNANIDEKDVFVTCTHNHEGPFVASIMPGMNLGDKQLKYINQIFTALKEAVIEASSNLVPAKMGFNKGKSYINANRDEENGDNELGINFERPSDKTLNLVRFDDLNNKPIAFIVNFAVHCTCVNGVSVGNDVMISGDISGNTSAALENKYEGSVCMWTSGAAGDQSPRIPTQFGLDPNSPTPRVKNLGEAGYMILEFLVNEHVKDILKTNDKLVCDKEDITITSNKDVFMVEGRIPESLKLFMGDKKPDPCQFITRLVTLGDVAFEGVSAEVVTSIGQAIKEVSPYENTMVITHLESYITGYVPDDWGFEHNTFEAKRAKMAKGVAKPALVESFEKLFYNIK